MAVGLIGVTRDTKPLGFRRVYPGIVPNEKIRREIRDAGRAREITEDFLTAVARLDEYLKDVHAPGELIVSPVSEDFVDITFRVPSYMGDGHSTCGADSFSFLESIANKLKIDEQVRGLLSEQEYAEHPERELVSAP